jgi:hypothetical protein
MCDQVVEKRRVSRAAALLLSLTLLSWGCSDVKERPLDSGTSCGLHDGRHFPVGAVFSDGCGCCICTASGGNCYGGNVCTGFVDGGFESYMSLPRARAMMIALGRSVPGRYACSIQAVRMGKAAV